MKCMDYEVKRADGKLISYKLHGHSVIPVEVNTTQMAKRVDAGDINACLFT